MKTMTAFLLIVLFGCAAVQPEPEPTTFDIACEYIERDYPTACLGMEAPIVVKSGLVLDHYLNFIAVLRGVHYPGEKFVFVRPDLRDEEEYRTVIHETVHYITHQAGIDITRCYDEELARRIGAESVGGTYSGKWKEYYGCDDNSVEAGTTGE